MTILTIYEGNDKNWVVTVKNSSGTAIDITGYTFIFTVKQKMSDSDDNALIKKDITSHSDPTAGKTTISISRSETLNHNGTFYYDLQWVDSSNKRRTILAKDKFNIIQSVGDREVA